jgi:hypothetical protein
MRRVAEAATRLTLDLEDPSGQAPANGRTDDHVWVDVGYQLCFETMAELMRQRGAEWLAGQYRHAAELAFQNIARWRRTDAPWDGSYFITKNRFDPALRVGYQDATQYSNYSGSLMFHLAEAYHTRRSDIREEPAPAEIGGYAVATDPEFASVLANAGGMQIQANLRGQTKASDGNRWTPLGLVRFARVGWDTRLGPSDGALTESGGVSFAPEFSEDGHWWRMADLSARYEASWSVQFVHPLLVRGALEYRPRAGQSGPSFRDELAITPDGVLSTVVKTSRDATPWGVTWPVLENDGTPLARSGGDGYRSTGYPGSMDRENFLALDPAEMTEEPLLRGSYGDLRPIRVVASRAAQHTFIYPRGEGDPDAETVRRSVRLTAGGWQSSLGWVDGTIYAGRTAAGGFGSQIDLDGDGAADVVFNAPCGFVIQLRAGRPVAIEADRDIQARIFKKRFSLQGFHPVTLP